MRGRDIAFYLLWYFFVVSCGFYIQVVDFDNLLQEVSESSAS